MRVNPMDEWQTVYAPRRIWVYIVRSVLSLPIFGNNMVDLSKIVIIFEYIVFLFFFVFVFFFFFFAVLSYLY